MVKPRKMVSQPMTGHKIPEVKPSSLARRRRSITPVIADDVIIGWGTLSFMKLQHQLVPINVQGAGEASGRTYRLEPFVQSRNVELPVKSDGANPASVQPLLSATPALTLIRPTITVHELHHHHRNQGMRSKQNSRLELPHLDIVARSRSGAATRFQFLK
jgi:hypothetical protein